MTAAVYLFPMQNLPVSFNGLPPAIEGFANTINFPDTRDYWYLAKSVKLPVKENYALRLSGFLQLEHTGDYTFYLNSDDGSRVSKTMLVWADISACSLSSTTKLWLTMMEGMPC